MAYNHASAFLLITLILFAAANPLAHGTIFRSLQVSGLLCCTSTGNCLVPGSQPVSGVLVRLNCVGPQGGITTVGTTTTGVNGRFTFTVPSLAGILSPVNLQSIPCVALVNLPLTATICPVLSTVNGTLVRVVGAAVRRLTRIDATVLVFVTI